MGYLAGNFQVVDRSPGGTGVMKNGSERQRVKQKGGITSTGGSLVPKTEEKRLSKPSLTVKKGLYHERGKQRGEKGTKGGEGRLFLSNEPPEPGRNTVPLPSENKWATHLRNGKKSEKNGVGKNVAFKRQACPLF